MFLVSPTMVLAALKTRVLELDSNTVVVYSQDLAYDQAVKAYRSNMRMNSPANEVPKQLPLFAYNRSPLRPADYQGRRFNQSRTKTQVGQYQVDRFRFAFAEFDFRFTYYFNHIKDAEEFEVRYITDIYNENSSLEYDMSAIGEGPITYVIQWNPSLDELNLNTQDNSYINLSGSATISGPFIIVDGSGDVIRQIHVDIMNSNRSILDEFIVE